MVSNIIKIFKDEFLSIFKDKGASLIMAGAIFLYGFFYMVPFWHDITRNVPIGVIDNDNSKFSRELIRELNAHENLSIVSYPQDLESAKEEYYQNKIRAFVVIPKDFEKNFKKGIPSNISSYLDSAYLIIYKQAAAGIIEVTRTFGIKIETGALMKKGLPKEKALKSTLPFDFIQNPLYNPQGSYQSYLYPMILVMILQQTMVLGVMILGATLREKIQGTKTRNQNKEIEFVKLKQVSPYSNNALEIVLGKSISYVVLYLLYSAIYFLIFPSIVVYQMSYKLDMIFILIPFLFATAFFAMSLVYFCKKREYGFFIMVVSSVPLVFFPGLVWAREAINPVLYFFSKFIPFESAANALIRINIMGASLNQVMGDFWILIGLCVLYFTLACIVADKIIKEAAQNHIDNM